jgi:hypothetical protein
VTVVVSLGESGVDFVGGLHLATSYHERHLLPLRRGDAVVSVNVAAVT